MKPVTFEIGWTHLSDLPLADLVNLVELTYNCLVLTFSLRYYVRVDRMVLLAPPQLSKLTLAGWSVKTLGSP